MISLILSGGVGARLWPVSREKLPKQFSPLFPQTLFTQTAQRLQKKGEVYVCTSESMRGLTESAIRSDNLQVQKAFYEPCGRNTAPAIGLVCKYLQDQGRGSDVVGVFPSDHWIEKEDTFMAALDLAEACAKKDQIVTIGLQPTYPATGFGYIECSKASFLEAGDLKAFQVRGFKEKPDLATAQSYLEQGHFFWNSGMFVFQVSVMVQAFQKFLPDMWGALQNLDSELSNIDQVYGSIEPVSIDYGIMEKVSNQVNIPCEIGWNDLGSWDDIAGVETKVATRAERITHQSNNCYSFSDTDKTVCFSNVDDLIVVDTADAILVTKKGASQSVKEVVNQLNGNGSSLTRDHVFEHRPWGMYRNLHEEKEFKAKVITVDPGQQLSYQSHTQRAEIWVTVVGEGEVVLNDEVISVKPGVVVHIPVAAKHRMRNNSASILKFVEVQLGDYFGEDDITRYSDDYKRV